MKRMVIIFILGIILSGLTPKIVEAEVNYVPLRETYEKQYDIIWDNGGKITILDVTGIVAKFCLASPCEAEIQGRLYYTEQPFLIMKEGKAYILPSIIKE